MKKLFICAATAIIALVCASCGGGRSSETAKLMDQQTSQLTEALRANDYATAATLADSMALYIDELTPEETIAVLMAFLEVHNKVTADNPRSDLETLRKYVDVYDIAVGANPNDMRRAFAEAKARNPQLDFEQAARDFRRLLAEYDAVQTYGEEPVYEPEPADSSQTAAADSLGTSVDTSLMTD